jgi:glucan 1,3-beta-glucosidase
MDEIVPNATLVIHNAFMDDDLGFWDYLFPENFDNIVLDRHYYQAWSRGVNTTEKYCSMYEHAASQVNQTKFKVWIGEWSLATDNCALWLGGLNDGPSVNPGMKCRMVDCPKTYLPESVAVDFDRDADILGPFGTGNP